MWWSRPIRRTFSSTASCPKQTRQRRPPWYLVLGGGAATVYLGCRAWQWHVENDKRLAPERYVGLDLVDRQQLNHNAFRLRLATDRQQHETFPVLSCLYVKDDSVQVMRAYTPINDPFKDGHVDLLVKRYEQGSISRMLSRTPVGDKVYVRGPMLEYDYQPNSKDEIGMVRRHTIHEGRRWWWITHTHARCIDCRRYRHYTYVSTYSTCA